MARRNRQILKREMAQAHFGVDRALKRIQSLHGKFGEHHEKHTEYLELIAQVLLKSQSMMLEFWVTSWGKLPDNLDSYRT